MNLYVDAALGLAGAFALFVVFLYWLTGPHGYSLPFCAPHPQRPNRDYDIDCTGIRLDAAGHIESRHARGGIQESMIKKGGTKPSPTMPRPNVTPGGREHKGPPGPRPIPSGRPPTWPRPTRYCRECGCIRVATFCAQCGANCELPDRSRTNSRGPR